MIDATQPDYINALHSRVALGRKGVDEQMSDWSMSGGKKEMIAYNAAAQTPSFEGKQRKGKRNNKANNKNLDRKEEESYLQTLAPFQRFDYLSKKLHFSLQEILNLNKMFTALTKASPRSGYMNRSIFTDFCRTSFDITDDIMLDQMFHYFDADQEGFISFTEWIAIMSVFLRGTFEEQIEYCFNIYDLNFNGSIERKEITTLVYDCLADTVAGQDDSDIHEHVREIVEMFMRKLDVSKIGSVKQENFREAVLRDSSLLQCLGKCLPDQEKIISFLGIFTDDLKNYTTNYCLESVGTAGFQYEHTRHQSKNKRAGQSEYRIQNDNQKSKTTTYHEHHRSLPRHSRTEHYKSIESPLFDHPLVFQI
jgi:Ca2+-binding EF-hand superfamily protein